MEKNMTTEGSNLQALLSSAWTRLHEREDYTAAYGEGTTVQKGRKTCREGSERELTCPGDVTQRSLWVRELQRTIAPWAI